ncbi:hypothetical protein BSKO_12035 [Bryopsis sp. KO-2023]|nr:hypothetical protein BSKO_12035 [Bryopsis sp. KO-2023]
MVVSWSATARGIFPLLQPHLGFDIRVFAVFVPMYETVVQLTPLPLQQSQNDMSMWEKQRALVEAYHITSIVIAMLLFAYAGVSLLFWLGLAMGFAAASLYLSEVCQSVFGGRMKLVKIAIQGLSAMAVVLDAMFIGALVVDCFFYLIDFYNTEVVWSACAVGMPLVIHAILSIVVFVRFSWRLS